MVVLGAALAAVWRVRRWLAVLLALVPLGINLAAFLAIDPVARFSRRTGIDCPSRECVTVARRCATRASTAVWMNHWAGQPLMFDARAAGQELIAYDYYDVQAGGIDRFPEFRAGWPRQSGQRSCWSPTKLNRPWSPSYGDWE